MVLEEVVPDMNCGICDAVKAFSELTCDLLTHTSLGNLVL